MVEVQSVGSALLQRQLQVQVRCEDKCSSRTHRFDGAPWPLPGPGFCAARRFRRQMARRLARHAARRRALGVAASLDARTGGIHQYERLAPDFQIQCFPKWITVPSEFVRSPGRIPAGQPPINF